MKISTSQLFDASIAQMNRQQSNVAEMQAKLASGKSLVKPSDDAEKAALIQRLNSAMQRQDVFRFELRSCRESIANRRICPYGRGRYASAYSGARYSG